MPEATATAPPWAPAPAPPDPPRRPGSDAPATDAPDGLAAEMVDALAVAWTMFRVYNDPRHQDAFRRAVATLGAAPAFPWMAEVHSGGFRYEGLPVPTRRQATPVLARAAFARGISALGFSAPPTPDDLFHLFEVLTFQEDAGAERRSPAEALEAAGATRLIVVEHGRLTGTLEGLHEAEALVPRDEDPRAGRGEAHRGDPSRHYLDEYRLLYERLQAGDFSGLQELVHEFTESFFSLPREHQTGLFEHFLTRHQEEPFRLLLDQFSQDDLAELAQLLSPGTHPLLVDYARIAAEQDGQTTVAGEMAPAEQMVSDRIASLLHTERAGLRHQVGEALRAQIPGPETNFRAGVDAASALFCLTDDAGFVRLARTVASKAASGFAAADLHRATTWGRALLSGASSPGRKEVVRREMEAALQPDTLDGLVAALAAGSGEPPADAVTLFALFALGPTVDRLAVEDDPARHRALVDLLAAAARLRPGPLVRRLDDPRWYLVLPLVEILARSGRPEAVAGLRAACAYRDPRVRREALRSLAAIDQAEGTAAARLALRDPESAVRLQALNLLCSAPGPEVDTALAAFLESTPPAAEAIVAVEVLARHATATARAALRRVARRRLWASPAARQMQRAAGRALKGGGR